MSSGPPVKKPRVQTNEDNEVPQENVRVNLADEEVSVNRRSHESSDETGEENDPELEERLIREERERAEIYLDAQIGANNLDLLEDLYLEALAGSCDRLPADPFSEYRRVLGEYDLNWIASLSCDNQRRVERLKKLSRVPNSLETFGSVTLIAQRRNRDWRYSRLGYTNGERTEQG